MAEDESACNAGCLLVVDDEATLLKWLDKFLRMCGFEVFLADSYGNAVKVLELQKDRIETILSDIAMPDKSGLDLLKYVNAQKLNIPVIFLTGNGTLDSCQEAVRSGAFDYILKPIEGSDKLVISLRRAVEKHRQQIREEEKNLHLQTEIARMVSDMEGDLGSILKDVDEKDDVETRISEILARYEKPKR